jgi:hypothetical protein
MGSTRRCPLKTTRFFVIPTVESFLHSCALTGLIAAAALLVASPTATAKTPPSAPSAASATTRRAPSSVSMIQRVQKSIKDGLAGEIKIDVQVAPKTSLCGGEEKEVIFATVSIKKLERTENGPKEIWQEFDHYSAYADEYNKTGYKAFMRDNQCME